MRVGAICFDFDGVLVDSAHIRIDGFRQIFADQPVELVDRLIDYHVANGGVSRYAKIRWFFETLRGVTCDPADLERRAAEFTRIMRTRMVDRAMIVQPVLEFVRDLHGRLPMHICSGSDGDELRFICRHFGIDGWFDSILGSPTPKTDLVRNLMTQHGYDPATTIFVGDAINDYDAARANGLTFCGINNERLRAVSAYYIDDIAAFATILVVMPR